MRNAVVIHELIAKRTMQTKSITNVEDTDEMYMYHAASNEFGQ